VLSLSSATGQLWLPVCNGARHTKQKGVLICFIGQMRIKIAGVAGMPRALNHWLEVAARLSPIKHRLRLFFWLAF
jgi:hypothetical protein